jgi:hypothetical protein
MARKDKPTPQEIHMNNALPILYVDAISSRARQDGMIYVSLATNTPHLIAEQVRLMIDEASLQTVVDNLCETLGYYPQKPRRKPSPSSDK